MSIATMACLIYVYANGIYRNFNEIFLPSIIHLGLVTIAVTHAYIYIYQKVSTHMGEMNNKNRIGKAKMSEFFKKREKKLVMYSIFVFSSFAVSWLPYALAKTSLHIEVIQPVDHRAAVQVPFSFLLLSGVIDPFLFQIYVHKKPVNNVSTQRERKAIQITVIY